MNNIYDALKYIPCSELSYEEWTKVGMALKADGFDLSVWDEWSRADGRYKSGECAKKWNTFKRDGVASGTIFAMAKERGYNPMVGHALDWDEEIQRDEPMETAPWDRKSDIIKYLSTIFKPNEFVCFVTNDVYEDSEGKWRPGKGVCSKTAGNIIAELERRDDVEDVLYDAKGDCGAWICFNPLNGQGRTNDNVTAYRFALVESDTMSVVEQERFFRASGMPIAAMVSSGGKSIHAIVHIDAKNKDEYRERVSSLYSWLADQNVAVDEQNKNPSRLSRLPGYYRGGREQRLLAINLGPKSWEEWQANIINDDLPGLLNAKDFIDTEIELAPELIQGILRKGHKGIISGESKAGKTWMLLELAAAIASGTKWLGEYQCLKGAVLYINFEVDDKSFSKRVQDVCRALSVDVGANLVTWNLRGHAQTLDKLLPAIIKRTRLIPDLGAIIIDPIYKINPGDENNAGDMGRFCNLFDELANKTGCSVLFCHHFSKGGAAGKRAIDRASGSGVFARDPDAILTISRLASKKEDDGLPAFRLESALREFPDIKPLNMWFKHPIHVKDDNLADRGMDHAGMPNLEKSSKRTHTNDDKIADFENAFEATTENDRTSSVKDMADYLNLSDRSIKNYAKLLSGDYEVKGGVVVKLK